LLRSRLDATFRAAFRRDAVAELAASSSADFNFVQASLPLWAAVTRSCREATSLEC
jgi:predicted HAD superfamily Cof-like phosphohydrolase